MKVKTVYLSSALIMIGLFIFVLPSCITKDKVVQPSYSRDQSYTGEFPYMVRLLTEDRRFFCSGSVISDNYVLTAAHCLSSSGTILELHKGKILVESQPIADGTSLSMPATVLKSDEDADYGIIKGDFSRFAKAHIDTSSMSLMTIVGPVLTCGFPRGAEAVCYRAGNSYGAYFGQISLPGLLFPGMSGGPVIDAGTGLVVAVNSAVGQNYIVVSPLIGLFNSLGIREEK